MNARALAYGGLGFNGAVLITLGILAVLIPWLAVTLMFVIGVAVVFTDVLSEPLGSSECLGDRVWHQCRIAQRGEANPEHPTVEVANQLCRRLDSQPRLARTARARQ